MKLVENLLPKVKANLIIDHKDDDELLCNLIRSALDYAENYQRVKYKRKLPPSTEQAIIMLSSFWYESRDGGSGGFMSSAKGDEILKSINWLLALNKSWSL